MKKHFTILAILLITILWGQSNEKPRIRLINANELEQYMENGTPVKKLTDDIHFKRGAVDLYCEEAYWYEEQKKVKFYTDVVVTKENQTLKADTVIYDTEKNVVKAKANPRLKDSSATLTADRLEYYLDEDLVKCFGNVKMTQKNQSLSARRLTYYIDQNKSIAVDSAEMRNNENKTSLASDSIVYNTKKEEINAYKNPVLTKIDEDESDTTKIFGDYIKGLQGTNEFSVKENVRIIRSTTRGVADSAFYSDSTGIIDLYGEPEVVQNSRTINGEYIQARLKEDNIEKVNVEGNAIASTIEKYYLPGEKDSSNTEDSVETIVLGESVQVKDEITGQKMDLYFESGEVDSIRVSGMATSYYNVAQDSILQGHNRASGDTIAMRFSRSDSSRKLGRISIIGGSQGEFIPHESNTEMDTTVQYSSERIDYYVQSKETWLLDEANVEFKDMKLTAGKIHVLWNRDQLIASPLQLQGESKEQDTLKGIPEFTQEGREPFTGEKMVYNIKTRKGRIIKGQSYSDQSYYHGDRIMKTDQEDTYYIKRGKYTTCDLDHPHYYFQGQKMKIVDQDLIIARPLVLYLYDIPIIGIPFAVVPKRGGKRRSGWIMPTYADNSHLGPHLRGLGYFWAVNDYTDLKLTADFFTNRGIRLNYQTRYKLRYKFNGNINGFYEDRFLSENNRSREYKISITHHHNISPTMNLDIDASFISEDNYYQSYGVDLEDRLQQQIVNRANFSKTWREKPYSFSASARQTINLQAKQQAKIDSNLNSDNKHLNYINREFPNISFDHGSEPIFPTQSGKDKKWYNKIYFGFDSEFQNRQKTYYESGYYDSDTSLSWKQFRETDYGMSHNFSLNGSQKVLSYFSLNENISIQEEWIFEYERPKTNAQGYWLTDTSRRESKLITEQTKSFLPRHTGSASMGVNTKLYGLFPLNIGALRSVRHIMTPNISLSYRPDFTGDILGWDPGYIKHGQDTAGRRYSYDLFRNTLYGRTSTGESRSLNFSLSNVFQAKAQGEEKVQKIDLFDLQMSTGYNFAADSNRLSPLRSSLRTQLGNGLNIDLNATHEFYTTRNGRVIDEFYNKVYGIPLPQLRSVSGQTGFSLESKSFQKDSKSDTTGVEEDKTGELNRRSDSGNSLWTADFNFRYETYKTNSGFEEDFSATVNASVNLTQKWQIGYRADLDLTEKRIKHQSINIHRDLHCWEMSFNWTPGGYGSGYVFRINVKASALQDLKYEEKSGRASRVTGVR